VSGMGECVWVAIDVKVDTQGCVLGEDIADLRFELGVTSSAAKVELVLVVLSICSTPEAVKRKRSLRRSILKEIKKSPT
jgi:hypothetical protein